MVEMISGKGSGVRQRQDNKCKQHIFDVIVKFPIIHRNDKY